MKNLLSKLKRAYFIPKNKIKKNTWLICWWRFSREYIFEDIKEHRIIKKDNCFFD